MSRVQKSVCNPAPTKHLTVCGMGAGGDDLAEQRKVVMVTSLGKVYRGMVDVPNVDYRTTDLLNSSNVFWKDSSKKCFENSILVHDVQMMIGGAAISVRFDALQVRISEIVYFYDDQQTISDSKEKMRATSMVQKAKEASQTIDIITIPVANSFYHLTGTFFGLFKKKTNDKFIPLTGVKLTEVYQKTGKWYQKTVELPYKFVGISTRHIEALRIQ